MLHQFPLSARQSRSLPPPVCFSTRLVFSYRCGACLGVLSPSSIGCIHERSRSARFSPAHFLLCRLTGLWSLIRSREQRVVQISLPKLLLSDLVFCFLLISFSPHEEWCCPLVVFVHYYLSILQFRFRVQAFLLSSSLFTV
jgi:hypothetical protein